MSESIHSQARTAHKIRAEIRNSTLSLKELAECYNVRSLTIRKWKNRNGVEDGSHRPNTLHTTLTPEHEAICRYLLQTGKSSLQATPVVKKSNERVMAELEAVKKAIGKAACDSNDQCKTVAMGAKACGGPEFFLAFSGKAEQAAKVPDLAQKHRMAREAQIAAEGEMSDCKVVSDPGAQCNAGKCVLLPAKAGASAS